MQCLDRLHLEYPFAGSRMLRGLLALQGCKIGRRHVKTLMRRMGIEALYRRPRTTKPEPGHKIYPYLLRGIEIRRPNQVWAMDITYIPMGTASSISPWCWTGRHVVFCCGDCRSRWRRPSASRRWRMLSLVMAGRIRPDWLRIEGFNYSRRTEIARTDYPRKGRNRTERKYRCKQRFKCCKQRFKYCPHNPPPNKPPFHGPAPVKLIAPGGVVTDTAVGITLTSARRFAPAGFFLPLCEVGQVRPAPGHGIVIGHPGRRFHSNGRISDSLMRSWCGYCPKGQQFSPRISPTFVFDHAWRAKGMVRPGACSSATHRAPGLVI